MHWHYICIQVHTHPLNSPAFRQPVWLMCIFAANSKSLYIFRLFGIKSVTHSKLYAVHSLFLIRKVICFSRGVAICCFRSD